jgi:hypothetical protein
MKADKYTTLRNSRYRKQQNETNDCSVFAIAIACRLTYKKAHEVMSMFGRRNRKGVDTFTILRAAQYLGFDLAPVKNLKQKTGSAYTPKSIGKKLKTGYHLAFVHGHVLGVVNGTVYDWTDGRQHRIKEAYKVTRKRAK